MSVLHIPGTCKTIKTGDVVCFPDDFSKKFLVHNGTYLCGEHSHIGWYLTSIPENEVMPLSGEALYSMINVTEHGEPVVCPSEDVDRPEIDVYQNLRGAWITVQNDEEKEALGQTDIADGKIILVADSHEFFRWKADSLEWVPENFGFDPNLYLRKGTIRKNFLKKADAESTYLPKSEAETTYLKTETAEQDYLKQSDAEDKYLKITDAERDYLKQDDAGNTYLKKTEAQRDYLQNTAASTTYLKIHDADSKFMTDAQIDAKYLTEAEGAAKYLTESQANQKYLTESQADLRYQKKDG